MKLLQTPATLLAVLSTVVCLCLSLSINANACTTIFWNNNKLAKVVARSMDLYISESPQLLVTPRGIPRTGDAGDNSIRWNAKYGSVVVTAFNTQAASDGMNEEGLSAHLLYLDKTTYGKRDPKAEGLANTQWAQYVLDNFTTVKEALDGLKDIQIVSKAVNGRDWPIHLAMEDASGDSAIIEYIDGRMDIYHGSQYQVMTNEPAYHIQLENLKKYQTFGGKLSLPGDADPLSRFVRGAFFLKTLPEPKSRVDAIAGVLSVIRTCAVPFGAVDISNNGTVDAWPTRWMIVADMTDKVYYFNSTTAPNVVWLDFSYLDFKEGSPQLTVDPANLKLVGEISRNLAKSHTK
jgi:penicillin V acylase-like amidase (Ntn superfamily)